MRLQGRDKNKELFAPEPKIMLKGLSVNIYFGF